jgi:ABC-type transport system substrate-binding protein
VLVALLGASAAAMIASPPHSNAESSAPSTSTDRIVIGFDLPPFASSPFVRMSNAFGVRPPLRADIVMQLLYNGLYRYNDKLEAVPDLAARPCDIADDKVTITCTLVDATFHDGTSMTADDVAYTYEMARRDQQCRFGFGLCMADMIESAVALDPHTVQFTLTKPDATFLTLALPEVMIDSKAVVEAAYAPLAERASTLDPSAFEAQAALIAQQLKSASPNCDALLPGAEALLQSAGLGLLPRDQYRQGDGVFDPCLYGRDTAGLLMDVARSLRSTDHMDAVTNAYEALSFNQHPIGTGPWRFAGVENGTTGLFTAFEDYHFGPPATREIEVRPDRTPTGVVDGLRSGEIDWSTLEQDQYNQVSDAQGLSFAEYPEAQYNLLAYNLRPGMLFADPAPREAIALCIDKPATVDAATDGTGQVVYSPTSPISWAFEPDLRQPTRDVAAARAGLEAAGWSVGPDGIYVKNGQRLAADVYVRADVAERNRFMDLVAEQVLDCGIELNVVRADTQTVLDSLSTYPNIPLGTDQPFQATFLAFGQGFDPDDPSWSSRQITTAANPYGMNFMGYSNPTVDQLLDEGIATYDQRDRARIYRQFQNVLADDQPALFAWSDRVHDALDSRLRYTDGPINMGSRMWWWQPEKLTLAPN